MEFCDEFRFLDSQDLQAYIVSTLHRSSAQAPVQVQARYLHPPMSYRPDKGPGTVIISAHHYSSLGLSRFGTQCIATKEVSHLRPGVNNRALCAKCTDCYDGASSPPDAKRKVGARANSQFVNPSPPIPDSTLALHHRNQFLCYLLCKPSSATPSTPSFTCRIQDPLYCLSPPLS